MPGYTLVETVVTIGIFSIIMLGATTMLREIFVTSTQQTKAINGVDQARLVVFNFSNELRNSTTANNGAAALNDASSSQIILYTTFGSNSSTTVRRVRYYLSGTSLFKGIITPSGNPLTYNSASETVSTVLTDVSNGTSTPIFYYYADTYAGTTSALTQPVNITQVKFAKMNLLVKVQNIRTATTTYTIQAGGTLRSLKTNLGN
ncbi:MAG: hypothetical protein RL094_169 [Candidatus Parcubacteria bacterium]|jgi:type II secretory pathway component PulJ